MAAESSPTERRPTVVELLDGIKRTEAELLLRTLLRLKERRFGRLVIVVNDGRIVDVEVSEKVNREVLNSL